jgi:hypothetical protein
MKEFTLALACTVRCDRCGATWATTRTVSTGDPGVYVRNVLASLEDEARRADPSIMPTNVLGTHKDLCKECRVLISQVATPIAGS